MTNVKQFKPEKIPALGPIWGYTNVGAWTEFSTTGILDKHGPNPILGSGEDLRKLLGEIRGELETGTSFGPQMYVLVAQKPIEA
jgi:hypothetical protein